MQYGVRALSDHQRPSPLWPFAMVVLCALVLSSCRGPVMGGAASGTGANQPQGGSPALPPEAFAGGASAMVPSIPQGPPGMEQGIPLPYAPTGPWAPPGLRQPWPQDEYLADGGDHPPAAYPAPDKEVKGLNFEDTVAHYDAMNGRTLIEPSNRVYVYSPRFRAVRQVVSVEQNAQAEGLNDVHLPTKVAGHERVAGPNTSTQNLQAQRQTSQSGPITYWMRQGDGALSTAIGPRKFHNSFQPYENLSRIRNGFVVEAEMPFLADGVTAANIWANHQAVQVVLDHQVAVAVTDSDKLSTLYTVKEKPSLPKLRLIKVASTQFAEPGDTIDFTLRFDNVGNELLTNITLLDNLTTRLEYVPDSTQSSVPAEFSAMPNEGGSQVLRWIITRPIKPGEGGIVRFRCRVR